ncbi:hypothetical protein AB6A40_001456 [Gnathostoma spinigerum]|uniref:receptor protein-tyrosine kinase n=1 Tax=Gnathostoma spinigerum TaxID=75299 RepID=A0ABD6EDH1_9BILA
MNDSDIIEVYLPDGNVKNVRYDFGTTVQRIIDVVLSGLHIDRVSRAHFALCLMQVPFTQSPSNNECFWLHPHLTMRHIYGKYFSDSLLLRPQLCFSLRLRFIPTNLQEMYQTQMDAFMFLHDQILADYATQISWKLPIETAIELAALQIRSRLGSITQCTVERSIDFDELEYQGFLIKVLPESIHANMKPKALRKALIAGVKRNASLSPIKCILRFLNILLKIAPFDVEIFRVCLGCGWTTPIDIYIGQRCGISYKKDNLLMQTPLTELSYIVDIILKRLNSTSDMAVVQLRLTGSPQPMLITVPTMTIGESLAHLLNGYQFLLCQQSFVWHPPELMVKWPRRDELVSENSEGNSNEKSSDDMPQSSSSELLTPGGHSLISVDRSNVTLDELLGDGQFGNVYRGTYSPKGGSPRMVAIKVCKIESDPSDMQSFLEEACVMRRFHHTHIIRLLGICMEVPVWLIMELAPLGELRQYLIHKKTSVDLSIQILFSHQLSLAIAYLHSHKFVHRDIAARNVLVSSHHCVKLSDFGLSRSVDENSFYTSTSGKLPIKWMAPESINFRRFSTATDVWMFGVCIWEILMYGVKPWQGVKNHDVILRLEDNERLRMPANCPSVLYELLKSIYRH